VAREVEGLRQRVVEVPERVRRIVEARQEALELLHLLRRELLVVAEQARERAVELLEAVLVAAPMVRLLADDVLERLREHRPLHRVEVRDANRDGGVAGPEVLALHRLHVARGIPEVPGEPVHARVDVTAAAAEVAEPRGGVGVVQVSTAAADRGWCRVVERHPPDLQLRARVHDRDRSLEAVEREEPVLGRLHDDAGGALADLDGAREARSGAGGVQHDDVVAAHARHERAHPEAVPRDPARVSERDVPNPLGGDRAGVVEVRVEVEERRVAARGRNVGTDHAPEDAVEVRLVAHVVDGVRADHGQHAGLRVHTERHDGVHEALVVRHREVRHADLGDVVVEQCPADGSAGEAREQARGQEGPVGAVLVLPAAVELLLDDEPDRRGGRQRGIHRRLDARACVRRWVEASVRPARVAHGERARVLAQDRDPDGR